MKLGTQTASLINHLHSRTIAEEINVGDGATLLFWTDRKAATVIDVFTKGSHQYFEVQEDKVNRTDTNGMSDVQTHKYTSNPNGCRWTFRVTEKGYQAVELNPKTGRYNKTSGNVMVGYRDHYYDYSF